MTLKEIGILTRTALRIAAGATPRGLWKIIYNFGWRNVRNMAAFERRQAEGKPFFPAFVMISVTESCNLACTGCWVSAGGRKQLTVEQLDGIISQSKKQGSYFFGILGGEPLMYKGLWEVIEKHSDCYFQLFTNATLLTDEIAQRMRRLGNV
ncbi:MAG: radical SAM protein, partial [Alistipes sp.]|nr:radical SAM protein [Alistipes sp.]